jgi:hypothetical protein
MHHVAILGRDTPINSTFVFVLGLYDLLFYLSIPFFFRFLMNNRIFTRDTTGFVYNNFNTRKNNIKLD